MTGDFIPYIELEDFFDNFLRSVTNATFLIRRLFNALDFEISWGIPDACTLGLLFGLHS